MDIKSTLKTSVAAAALMAVASPVSLMSSAQANDNKLTVSGHVNRAMVYNDNGGGSILTHIDNSASQTRFRLVASGTINDDWGVGARIEMDPNSNTTQDAETLTHTNSNYSHGDKTGVRHADVSFKHKTMGTFTFGHTSHASDGVADQNKSGASLVVNTNSLGHGNIKFHNDTNNAATTLTPGTFSIQGGRSEVMKYTSPTILSGLKVVASHGAEGNTDFAGYYGGTFGAFSVSAAAGYGNYSGSGDRHFGSGSIAIEHESGISMQGSAAWADNDATDDDASTFWIGAGYDVSVYEMGETSFAVGFGESNDEAGQNMTVDKWEIGFTQDIDAAGTNLYAGWRTWDLEDDTGDSYDDIMSFIAGARVAF